MNRLFNLIFLISISLVTPAAASERPNVLLILTDDQGWGDLGVHGNDLLQTPTLDRLASQSVRLDRFYVSPVCAPTRAALLSGRYPERTGVIGVTRRQEVMQADEVTLAELFSGADYATGCFGKWHNGAQMPLHPNGQGFREFFGFCGGHFNLYDDPLLERNGQPVQTQGYITDILTEKAIEFLRNHENDSWFCYVPYNAPHGPFQVNRTLFDKYNDGTISEKTAAVYAMVENIDSNVARLLSAIEEQGKTQDTIVIFLTDNGPNGPRYNGGMRGRKGSVHEGGCRVPCLIRWPGKLQPRLIEQITAHIDVLPTLADWCELELSDDLELDGKNLAKLLHDGTDAALTDRTILTNRPNSKTPTTVHRAAVRTNRFRLTIENGKTSLFEMASDPGQSKDVANQFPAIVKRLETEIRQYIQDSTESVARSRAVPVGGRELTFMPSVDAGLHGNPKFADGISWAHSWVDQWTDPEDRIWWNLNCLRSGKYEIVLHYVCQTSGVEVSALLGKQQITAALPKAAIKSVVRPDLDSKATPRRMLEFRTHPLGVLEFDEGESQLILKRLDATNIEVELGGLTLRRVEP